MSNIDAFLQSKFNIGLLTDEKIDYDDYNDLALSDEYEYQSDMEFWNVREGPNAKQTVSPTPNPETVYDIYDIFSNIQVISMKAMCEDEIIPSDYPPYGYNCHGGYEFSNGTGNILNNEIPNPGVQSRSWFGPLGYRTTWS